MEAKHYNKGTLKGRVSKSELIEYNSQTGKAKFLSIEVDTGDKNRVKGVMFPTKSNPNKAIEASQQFPVNSLVEASGNVQEKPYEGKEGKKGGIDRSISVNSIKTLGAEDKHIAAFVLQGIVTKIKEINDDEAEVELTIDASYTDKNKVLVVKEDVIHLKADGAALDIIDDLDIEKGDNVKFKGRIFNKLVTDDYGDIVGTVQEFKIDKAEDVIKKDEITKPDEASFL